MATTTTKFEQNPKANRTFAGQSKLPKLPIPKLEDSCKRYLRALEALQNTDYVFTSKSTYTPDTVMVWYVLKTKLLCNDH